MTPRPIRWCPRRAGAIALAGCALFAALAAPRAADAATLSGFVRAAESGEAIPYANVLIGALKRGAPTNQSGYYVLTGVPAGTYDVAFSMMGYRTEHRSVTLTEASPVALSLELATAPHEIETVEVRPQRVETGAEPGRLRLETSQLATLTAVGEADLFRAVQSLPGVSTLSDFSAGLYVRGGSADQNLILLDDIDVYNPSHLFGFFSTFNVDAVKNVDLQKGGFPARYGGRLSSLLDVHNRDGNRKRFAGVGRIGLVATGATLEGPWSHGSWMASGRLTNLAGLARAAHIDLPYGFYDVQSRVNWDLGTNDHTSLSVYSGRDHLDWDRPGLTLGLRWGNTTWSSQWTHVFTPRLFSHTILGHSKFDSHTDVEFHDFGYRARNGVEDLALKQDLAWAPSAAHKIDAGFEVKQLDFGFRSAVGDADPLQFDYHGTYAALYVQDAWRLSPEWRVQPGLRVDHYDKGGYWRVDPRLSVERSLGEFARVHATWGRYHQFLNLVSQPGASFADLWFPVDRTLSPGEADHWIVGADFGPFPAFDLSVEAYVKPYRNVVEFSQEFVRSLVPADATMGQLFNTGTGHSWGGEVFLRDHLRQWDGWVGYTFGVARRSIRGFNDGIEYYPDYDRRHQFVLVQRRPLGRAWTTSVTFHYGSGQPLTLPTGRYTIVDVNGRAYDATVDGERGTSRLPDYLRMDASAAWSFRAFHRWKSELEIEVVNLTNHRNVYIRRWDTSKNPARFDDITMLPLLPTLSLKTEF